MSDYPDFTVIARLKGDYAGVEKAVALDVDGNLKTLLYGTYGGANKQILVDVDGNVRMNLYAQDLGEMISRFKYGAPDFALYIGTPANGVKTDLVGVSGTGYIYMVTVHTLSTGANGKNDTVFMALDSLFDVGRSFSNLHLWGETQVGDSFFHSIVHDETNFLYGATFGAGYTFESSCLVSYQSAIAVSALDCYFFLAVI